MDNQNCFGCGKLLASGENKKRRRLLSSPSLETHLQTLSSLAADHGVDLSMLHTGYICRSCVGLMEKYQQLHKQLSNNLSGALPHMPKLSIAAGLDSQSTEAVSQSRSTEAVSQSSSTEAVSLSKSTEVVSQSSSTEAVSQSRSPALTVS